MRKILLVIQREYTTRVKKVSFWVLTIVVPLLMAVIYAIPVFLATRPAEKAHVLVVDDTQLFARAFQSNDAVTYSDAPNLEVAKALLARHDTLAAIVYIPSRETTIPNDAFLYYRTDAPNVDVEADVNRQLQEILRNNILLDVHNISAEDFAMINGTRINLHTRDIESGRDGYLTIKSVVGVVLALLVFFIIFLFGAQVMQGVMEEKTNRIVEVLVSSVKPFQLMMGKVVGICAVGLTQMLLWLLLGGIGMGAIQAVNADLFRQAEERTNITEIATKGSDATAQMAQEVAAPQVSELMMGLTSIDFGVLIGMFLFYALFGYLLYATLFAAVGSITDAEGNNNQFVLPLMAPLFLCLFLIENMMRAPSGTLATWLSIIPFTSPAAMLMRIPFGVPYWQLLLSVALLVAAVPLCTWLAAKIYRTGILQYGTRITYKTLFSWLKRK